MQTHERCRQAARKRIKYDEENDKPNRNAGNNEIIVIQRTETPHTNGST